MEGQWLRKADIMEKTFVFPMIKLSKKEWRRHVPCTSFCTCRCKTWREPRAVRRELTQHTTYKRVMVTPAFYTHLVLNHFDIQSRRGYSCRVSSFVWKISPHWHSELCVEVASCQHHLRPSQEKKRQRGASSTCEQQFAVRSWADLPWHCLSRNFKCNSVLNSRWGRQKVEYLKTAKTWTRPSRDPLVELSN